MKRGLYIVLLAVVGAGSYATWQVASRPDAGSLAETAAEAPAPAAMPVTASVGALPASPAAPAGDATTSLTSLQETTPAKPVRTRGLSVAQQTVGTVCETPSGECTVSPAPILSVCYCGGAIGTITR